MHRIIEVPGVGKQTESILHGENIYTTRDLVYRFPKKYESFIEDSLLLAVDKTNITTTGIVASTPLVINHRGSLKSLQFKLLVEHELYLVIAYRREFLKDSLKENMEIQVKGRFEKKQRRITASHIMLKPVVADLKPVYGIEGLYDSNISKIIRAIFNNHLISIEESMPKSLLRKRKLIDKYDMVYNLHFPTTQVSLNEATTRLKYEEALKFQLELMMQKRNFERHLKTPRNYHLDDVKQAINTLPYELTNDQKLSVNELFKDFKKPYPVKRLIQGDVGSGKTVVVGLGVIGVKTAGYQSAFMAPTEILAQQHYLVFKKTFPSLKVALLTGSTKEKEELKKDIEDGYYDLVIGTHALITDDTVFKNLGFVIIDEQHKFGVNARKKLEEKGNADIVYLSATPIPRTLAFVIFGDMEISNIREKPKGRIPVITKYFTTSQIESVFNHVQKELDLGHQVYFVAPSIESDYRGESVYSLYEQTKKYFNNSIFILHGQMSGDEKKEIMASFNQTKGSILISTSVIEVGLDVKNASMMVIFDGEYFGLSQLHQLRGRVGRSDVQSYCYVISEESDIERLRMFERISDGFKLSEYDLEKRGPGEFLGVRQSGQIDFKYTDIQGDFNLFIGAKEDALWLLEHETHLQEYIKNNQISPILD